MLLVMNSYHDTVVFKLPEAPEGVNWELLIETNIPETKDNALFAFGAEYEVTGRSLLLFFNAKMRRSHALFAVTGHLGSDG